MADEFGFHAALAIERLLEGEDHEHAVDVALDELDAVFLPGPELRADEEEDRDAEAMELFGELEVDVGEVDEDGERGAALADGVLETAKFVIDAGQVADDFGDAHDRHVFSADDAIEAGIDHALAAHANSHCVAAGPQALLQLRKEHGAIGFAAGFASRDEDGGIGHGCAVSIECSGQ